MRLGKVLLIICLMAVFAGVALGQENLYGRIKTLEETVASGAASRAQQLELAVSTTEVALSGDIIMRRNASLTGVPEDGACLVSLASLVRNEDRVLKKEVVRVKPSAGCSDGGS